jgi:UDP-N-acetylmuramoyl-L-alanyl-D-glutamate--2,6-diaminopimelate ligase
MSERRRDPRPLGELTAALEPSGVRSEVPSATIRSIAADSREVEPGALFVAVCGGRVDGHDYLGEAAARGAAAAVVEREPAGAPPLPLLRVRDSRRALAELAAAWYGNPADAMSLVGITGTMGKTSTLAFLESVLRAAGQREGSVGSLGVRHGGCSLESTGYTVPAPLVLHRALADLRARGCDVVSMEATTHAMTQERLHGVRFDLGVFTGLVPLEHSEYHPTFEDYAEAKLRFFDHLQPGAPLVYFADSPVLRALVAERDVLPVGCGTGDDSRLRLEVESLDAGGTSLRLVASAGLPRLDGSVSEPLDLRLRLPLVGRSVAANVLLAAGAATVLGADEAAIRAGLSELRPAPRRMQVVQTAPFTIVDDFGGHPDTVSAVFEVVGALPHRRLHVLSGYRGSRGPRINLAMGRSLGIWLRRVGFESFCLTAAEETSDERNRALPEERAAFHEALAEQGIRYRAEDRLDRALEHLLPHVREGDLLLILGTQGMDGAAARAVAGTGRR